MLRGLSLIRRPINEKATNKGQILWVMTVIDIQKQKSSNACRAACIKDRIGSDCRSYTNSSCIQRFSLCLASVFRLA